MTELKAADFQAPPSIDGAPEQGARHRRWSASPRRSPAMLADPGQFYQVVPAGVHLLDRVPARLARPADGAPPVGRRLGHAGPAHLRGVGADAAVHGAAVHPGPPRHARTSTSGRDADVVAADPILLQKQPYLNIPFFVARYVALLRRSGSGLAYTLSGWSRSQDTSYEPGSERKFRLLSGPGLLLLRAHRRRSPSVDWLMSLDPHWFSTIFGLLFLIQQALAALGFVLLLMASMSQDAADVAHRARRATSTTTASSCSPSSCSGPTSRSRSS